ncbi:XAC2610-related protein [Aquimarina algiphila]|uniref:XAC2610-related protein n=1 Tax=Aquimarina algiphila TaxID=2047982 RepID=UPI00232C1643|nr:SH3 domain-containing protein [Aquimarina algiphila]
MTNCRLVFRALFLVNIVIMLCQCKENDTKANTKENNDLETSEKDINIPSKKTWMGRYHLDLEDIPHMGEANSVYLTFDVNETRSSLTVRVNDEKPVKYFGEIIKKTNDTLVLQVVEDGEDIDYYICQYEPGYYQVSGSEIYMINPPNDQYDLVKSKIYKDQGDLGISLLYEGYVNSENGLNIRNEPSLKSDKIGTIPYEASVKVLRRTNNFENLNLGNGRIAHGQWVYISFFSSITNKEVKGYIYDYFINYSVDSSILYDSLDQAKKSFSLDKQCVMDNASSNFIYSMQALAYNEEDSPSKVRIEIQGITDENSIFQRLDYFPSLWYSYGEVSCDVRNYFEVSSDNRSIEIGAYGYFIIWDFNMDGLEDFAVLHDVGGSAGSIYDFFLQQENGTFLREDSFPFQLSFFPTSIDFENQTITEMHPIGCCKISTITYKKIAKDEWELVTSTVEEL